MKKTPKQRDTKKKKKNMMMIIIVRVYEQLCEGGFIFPCERTTHKQAARGDGRDYLYMAEGKKKKVFAVMPPQSFFFSPWRNFYLYVIRPLALDRQWRLASLCPEEGALYNVVTVLFTEILRLGKKKNRKVVSVFLAYKLVPVS